MKIILIAPLFLACFSLFTKSAYAASKDDPLLFSVKADKLELRDGNEGTITGWEGHFWAGKDLNKLWIKTEGEHLDGDTERAEVHLLYSRAIDPNWDLQIGLRHDVKPNPQRDWFAIGFYGVAPYFIEVDSAIFVKEGDNVNLRVEAEYEFMLTQKWVLAPEVELNWFSDDDDEVEIGSGFAKIEAGIRLRYEITRQIAPYIGINHEQLLGDTKDLAEAEGEDTNDTQAVAGLRFWF
jgi:copper resistance protein B